MPIFIKSAGDLASGVALRLHRAGYQVIMSDIAKPTMVRRTVSFGEAVFTGTQQVEEVTSAKANLNNYQSFLEKGIIPILTDVSAEDILSVKPRALIDAILAKKNIGTYKNKAYYTIALGPGFSAPDDVDVVIETLRGHYLGTCIYEGKAIANTPAPAEVCGYTSERVLRASCAGVISWNVNIGDYVKKGDSLGKITNDNQEDVIYATIDGTLRGALHDGLQVTPRYKIGDIDPRLVKEYCKTVSDKGLSLGGAVLETLLRKKIYPTNE